jgi:hypothetical protein
VTGATRPSGWRALTAGRGWSLAFPLGQGLVIGVIFIAVYLAAFHSPQPRHVPVAVAGAPAAAAVARQAAAVQPGAWDFIREASAAAAVAAVTHQHAYAALTGRSAAVLVVAGADGPSVTGQLTSRFDAAAGRARIRPAVSDVVPLPPGDSAGLVLFYLTFGSVLAAYLFAIAATTVGASLSARSYWAVSVVFSAVLGAAETLLAGPVFGALPGDRTVVFGLLVLLLVAVSGTAALLLTISRTFGAMISTVILLTLGAASGGQLAAAFLPAWLAPLARVLPSGLAINAMRGAVHFHGASVGTAFPGLALWAVVPVAVIESFTRLRRRRTPAPGPAATVSS